VSKVRVLPRLTTVQRHAKSGVQDDTYLLESPFRSRDVSMVGKAAGRQAKRAVTRFVARDADGRFVASLAVTTAEETMPPSTTRTRKVMKSKAVSTAKPKAETTAARGGAAPTR
jgi:hypothetical protein